MSASISTIAQRYATNPASILNQDDLILISQEGVTKAAPYFLFGSGSGGNQIVLAATVSGGYAVSTFGFACDVTAPYEFAGIALQGGNAGDTIVYVDDGIIHESGWNWVPSAPVFLASGGALTQTPPTAGYSFAVGFAQTSTSIFVRPQTIIQLSEVTAPAWLSLQTLSSAYTMPVDYNGISQGPVSIVNGGSVVLPDTSSWSIL